MKAMFGFAMAVAEAICSIKLSLPLKNRSFRDGISYRQQAEVIQFNLINPLISRDILPKMNAIPQTNRKD
jgi:hypothetical protein